MKVTIITPTYNDSKSIVKTFDSVMQQSYQNFEMIVIDDGSTDNTKEVIENYKKEKDLSNKIMYIHQENKDQLNALINGSQYINGDLVYILHSDDLMPSKDFLENGISYFENNNIDAIIGDLIIINENDEITNIWKALKYRNKKYIPALVALNNGCNIYGDFSIQRKEVFLNQVKENYLIWNTPFWIDMNNNGQMLNIKNAEFPILKYRIHSENYANNEIGKFNALNGELRTLTRLLSIYDIKYATFQSFIFQFIRKPIIRRLRLSNLYYPIAKYGDTKNKYKLIIKAIKNTYKEIPKNDFLESLMLFYKNFDNTNIIELSFNDFEIYKGKDIRIFTKKLFNHQLDDIYYAVFNEMKKGFRTIIVKSEKDYEKAMDLCKFLCIYPYVKIESRF